MLPHHKTAHDPPQECDKEIKVSTWPPNSPDANLFEHPLKLPEKLPPHYELNFVLTCQDTVCSTRVLVTNPVSRVGRKTGPHGSLNMCQYVQLKFGMGNLEAWPIPWAL